MILADTSVWADHLRRKDATMSTCLDLEEIVMHPFVLGELSMGSMPKYDATIASLREMPSIQVAHPDEVLVLVRNNMLMGTGIGYVDAHLLASCLIVPGSRVWTRDKRHRRAAKHVGVASALP
jgi:predicted nucleic acid-binding protein